MTHLEVGLRIKSTVKGRNDIAPRSQPIIKGTYRCKCESREKANDGLFGSGEIECHHARDSNGSRELATTSQKIIIPAAPCL
jgi:hypothetical protein